MESLNIFIADRNYANLLADLSRKTFYDSFAGANTRENMDKFLSTQFTHKMLREEVGLPENTFLLAQWDGLPIGYAKMRDGDKPAAISHLDAIEIARIYVEQSALGTGVGKALMAKCMEIASARDKDLVWLGVWEQNLRAIRFYSHWGFRKFSEHAFMLGDDCQKDWLMYKTLKDIDIRFETVSE